MNSLQKKSLYKVFLFVFVFAQFGFYFLAHPKSASTATLALTSASVTLGNSRLSYKAGVSGTPGAAATTIDIDTSSSPDNDTDHLFPTDDVCFSDAGENGCSDVTTYEVSSIIDTDTFTINPGLVGALEATDQVVASQSGSMVFSFDTQSVIPATGDILITIPAKDHATQACDGIPDSNTSLATNGFDLGDANNRIAAADITVTGCTNGNWVTTETITCGNAVSDHTIRIDRQTSSCAAGTTITVTIDSAPGIINPAPITSGHTQGVADIYTIDVTTRDGSDNPLDSTDIKVAPIESVLVSATVDETLSFTIAGVSSSTSACGVTTDITTTATAVPWSSTIAATNTFYDAAQDLEVSTNANGGYIVTVSENDELGINGDTCTGDADETDGCIPDTICDGGSCTADPSANDNWNTATNNGFGYSLEETDGTDAAFEYNDVAGACDGNFCAASFADRENSGTPFTIMSNANPVSSKNTYVCYRISIDGTQPAGYYQNMLRYTATATF